MEITIRDYKSTDYNDLMMLLKKVYDSTIDQITLEEKYITDHRGIMVAVTSDNVLVGSAFTEIQQDYVRTRRIIYVTYVAVDENYRKHGIGRKLFETIEDLCHKTHSSAVEFTSADYRIGAHEFYEKLGYAKKKTTHFIKEI